MSEPTFKYKLVSNSLMHQSNDVESLLATARVQLLHNMPVTITVDEEEHAMLIDPSPALQAAVKQTIERLDPGYSRDVAEVYWQDGQALILVPGEKHVRKQLVILVTELAINDSSVMSAVVKGWGDGIQDTRV